MVQPRCPMAAIIMPGALGLCFKRCLVHQSNLNAECATSSVHRKQRRHKNNLKLKSNDTKSNNTSTTTEVSPNNPSHHLQKEALQNMTTLPASGSQSPGVPPVPGCSVAHVFIWSMCHDDPLGPRLRTSIPCRWVERSFSQAQIKLFDRLALCIANRATK